MIFCKIGLPYFHKFTALRQQVANLYLCHSFTFLLAVDMLYAYLQQRVVVVPHQIVSFTGGK
jgi:hypothetical protein